MGPTALTFVRGDVATAAKAVADYAKATQLLPFKGGMMGGEELEIEQIRSLSRLPSREVLYGQLVGIVASPVGGLVRSPERDAQRRRRGARPGPAPPCLLRAARPGDQGRVTRSAERCDGSGGCHSDGGLRLLSEWLDILGGC